MKKTVMAFFCVSIVLLCGCTSYRFQADIPRFDRNQAPVEGKYRVVNISNHAKDGVFAIGRGPWATPDPWSIPGRANKMSESEVRRALIRRYPNVFTDAADGIPLGIEICSLAESKEGIVSVFVPFLVTVGAFPMQMTASSQCELRVKLLNDSGAWHSRIMNFQSKAKTTTITPLGLISYNRAPNAVSYRTGAGFRKTPHQSRACLADSQAVFIEAFSAGVIACLDEIEQERSLSPAPSTPGSGTLTETINQLKALRDAGILTEKEYEAKRKMVIEQL